MRFRNSGQYPVLILGNVSRDELTFRIIGSKSDQAEVKIERSGVGTVGPSTKEVKDPDLEEGKRVLDKPGWSGGYATAWRMTQIDGKWVKTWGDSSHYNPGPNIYRVGTKKKDKPNDQPTDATKGGDDGKQPTPAGGAVQPAARPAGRLAPRVPSVPSG